MAAFTWINTTASGDWASAANWTYTGSSSTGFPSASGDTATIAAPKSGSGTVTVNLTSGDVISIASVTITGGGGGRTASLSMQGGSLTTSGAVTLTTTDSFISGYGTIANGGAVSGSGTITATGGTLAIDGAVSTTSVPTFAIGTAAGSELLFNGTATIAASDLNITNANQTLGVGVYNGVAGNLTVTGQLTVYNGKIALSGGTITDTSGIRLGSTGSSAGTITGHGKVAAAVTDRGSGTNTITATGGTLEITGAVGTLSAYMASLTVGNNAGDTLKLDGVSYATAVTLGGANSTLEINTAGTLTVTSAFAIGAGTVKLDAAAGTVQLTDTAGLTLAGGTISGTGTIATATTLSGYGTVGIALLSGTSPGTITASGGTLDLKGAVNQTGGGTMHTLAIGTAANSVLKIDGTASSSAAIGLSSSANQTLEIGSTGALTISAAQTTTSGHIVLDSGSNLTISGAAHALTIGAGGLSGAGQVNLGANTLNGSGTITATGGNLTVTTTGAVNGSATTFAFDIANGSTFTVAGIGNIVGATQAPTLTFLTTGQTAAENFIDTQAAAGNVHLGTITGFSSYDHTYAHSDTIQLASFGSSDTISGVTANTITISGSGHSQTFTFSGVNTAAIHLNDAGGVNTLTICFMAGTMVRTPGGEAAIETLKVGDLVLTSEGVVKPVNWVGRQTVSTRFADPVFNLPIRVKAGAIAENVPARDLLVSPDHALLVDGVLIHAGALVNGTSIVPEKNVPEIFVYYHVELDDHSLILAENTPAETFVDNVDRRNFDNWAEFEALYPEGKAVEELPYPRAKAHRQVPVYIRVALAERALAIGAAAEYAVA